MTGYVGSASPRVPSTERPDRLRTVRRLYYYLVVLISSITALVALDNLWAALVGAWLPQPALASVGYDSYLREVIALNAGLLIVTVPLFLLHWRVIGGWLNDVEERQAGMRKFFLYAASAFALMVALGQLGSLIDGIAYLALGGSLANSTIWPSGWLYMVGMALTGGLMLYYWQWVLRKDGDYGRETGSARIWRQIYLLLALSAGLALLIFGTAALLDSLLRLMLELVTPALSSAWFPAAAASATALLLAGLLLTPGVWQTWQQIATRDPEEQSSALRRLAFYIAAVGGALAVLIPATMILRRLLLWSFAGFADDPLEVLNELTAAISFLPAGVVVWRRFAYEISRLEADSVDDERGIGPAATVRRIYLYAVAATGLVLFWIGIVDLVQVLLDWLLTTQSVQVHDFWMAPLATGLSLVAVGAPVWAIHWRTVQAEARLPGSEGAAERGSLPRRIYLYGVSLVGALVILFFLAQVFYRIILAAMDGSTLVSAGPELAENLASSAIAAIFWSVHLVALRGDLRLGVPHGASGAESRAPHPAAAPAARRDELEGQIAALEAELAHARAALAVLAPPDGPAPGA